MTRVFYPGSFDPITKGHMNIIEQACELFDEVIIGVLNNSKKKNVLFTPEERVNLIRLLYEKNKKIKVISSNMATVDLALLYECRAVIRGLRTITDFDYEIQLAQINKDISGEQVNTICLFADSSLQNVSSSVVKEVFALGKDVSKYVDPLIQKAMIEKSSIKSDDDINILKKEKSINEI